MDFDFTKISLGNVLRAKEIINRINTILQNYNTIQDPKLHYRGILLEDRRKYYDYLRYVQKEINSPEYKRKNKIKKLGLKIIK